MRRTRRCHVERGARREATCKRWWRPVAGRAQAAIRFLRLLGLLPAVQRGQSFVARPLPDVPLELLGRCGSWTSWMPNDPHDLARASALAAFHSRRVESDGGLAVLAAAMTDRVRNDWYGPRTSCPPIPAME